MVCHYFGTVKMIQVTIWGNPLGCFWPKHTDSTDLAIAVVLWQVNCVLTLFGSRAWLPNRIEKAPMNLSPA
jgi:hypothetical protein